VWENRWSYGASCTSVVCGNMSSVALQGVALQGLVPYV
jgi:hypothetical protein